MATLFQRIAAFVRGLLSSLFGGGGATRSPTPTTDRATASESKIQLPRDDAFREDQQLQWWYWTGHLTDNNGRHYGFELVFFYADASKLSGEVQSLLKIPVMMGQAAVTDISRNGFFPNSSNQPFSTPREIPDAFDFAVDDGTMTAAGGGGSDTLHVAVDGYTLDVQLRETRPPVLHYDGNKHEYGFGGYTYYYSRERMSVKGTLGLPSGVSVDVTGTAWFDRQWGYLWSAIHEGWQWLALIMDDGRSIMAFDFPSYSSETRAAITTPDGLTKNLGPGDFGLEVLGWWKSERSGIDYPAKWKLTGDAFGRPLVVTPVVADQEIVFWCGLADYWEGACAVTDAETGEAVGQAYVELAGFDQKLFKPPIAPPMPLDPATRK